MNDSIKNLLRDCTNSTNGDIEELSDDILNRTEEDSQFEKIQSKVNITGIKVA